MGVEWSLDSRQEKNEEQCDAPAAPAMLPGIGQGRTGAAIAPSGMWGASASSLGRCSFLTRPHALHATAVEEITLLLAM